jgi:putative transcriptional regulator
MPFVRTRSLSQKPNTAKQQLARWLCGLLFFAIGNVYVAASADSTSNIPARQDDESVFLVATEQLHGTSFQQTVILLTHYSKRGATGLTINRPTDVPLQQALPRIRQLKKRGDLLYLGGPVSTNAIFVLLRTLQPGNNMHRIAGDIYFATGKNVFKNLSDSITANEVRTYAGYAGWAAGQLQNEIERGDWLMIHTHPKIIFEEDPESLWYRLTKRWKGKWI